MRRVLATAFVCIAASANADVIRTYIGESVRIPSPGITAAYSLDNDCAEVTLEGDTVIVRGQNACVTHVTFVTGSSTTEVPVLVSSRLRSAENLRRAKLQEEHVQEGGAVSTTYSSNPGEVESSVNLNRSQGDVNTSVGFSLANGYQFSPNARRTAIPYLSLQFSGPSTSVTLFDSLVDQSPLTIETTYLRGFHLQTPTWFVHAGVASLTGFRQTVFERDPDRTVEVGYRFALTSQSGFTPAVQWIGASHQYVSGVSGYVGSLLYDYEVPQRFRLELEGAAGGGLAGAANVDYTGDSNLLQMRIRSTPRSFAGMSAARSRGFQGSGTFTHSFSRDLGIDVSASRDTYAFLDQHTQSNMTANARLQYHFHHFTVVGGAGAATLSRRNDPSIVSTSLSSGLSYDRRRFGNSFVYQYSHNRAQDLGSNALRDSVRLAFHRTLFTAYVSRQTQTPTVSYLLQQLPWLRQALLTAGVNATTPEEIQQFIQSNSDLIAGGYIRDLDISIASVRRQVGASAHWTAPRNFMHANLEWLWDNYQQPTGSVTSTNSSISLGFRLNRATDLTIGAALLNSHSPWRVVHSPLLTIGIRRQLGNVPDLMTRFQQRGWISGTVFADSTESASPDGQKGISGVTVVLDGAHRTQTDALGHYSFRSLPQGRHQVEVEYEDSVPYQFTTAPQVETEVNGVVNFGVSVRKALLMGTVHDDAHQPVRNVVVRISGPNRRTEASSSSSGTFLVSNLDTGDYTITLDRNSLPASTVVEGPDTQSLSIDPQQPGRITFLVRRLRSISGKAVCAGSPVNGRLITLHMDGLPSTLAVDEHGAFNIRDVSSGTHQLVVEYDGVEHKQEIVVPEESAIVHAELKVCTPAGAPLH